MKTGKLKSVAKKCILLLCLLASLQGQAQSDIQALLDAENNFAAFTSSHSIKEGFLRYLAASGIVFNQGKVVNAVEFYQKIPVTPTVLFWQPAFSVVSASGDLGMNTGPFTVRPTAADTVVARGSFSSIWKKNQAGEFKLLVDLGTSYNSEISPPTSVEKIVLNRVYADAAYASVRTLDSRFNTRIGAKGWKAIKSWWHPAAHVNIKGLVPLTGKKVISSTLTERLDKVVFQTIAGELSQAGDFAYFYGSFQQGTQPGDYLRVWVREGKKWRIILQTTD